MARKYSFVLMGAETVSEEESLDAIDRYKRVLARVHGVDTGDIEVCLLTEDFLKVREIRRGS